MTSGGGNDQGPKGTLLSELLTVSGVGPRGSDGYKLVRQGTHRLLDDLLRKADAGARKVDRQLVEAMITEIDRRMSAQVSAILHHPRVQQLEAAWRGARYLIDRIDFEQNIGLDLVHVTKEELRVDFEDAPDITGSGLYELVYRRQFGTLGGKPYAVLCSTHEFGPDGDDVGLLKQCAAVAAMAHAPILVNAAPAMFGLSSFTELPKIKDLPALFDGGKHARWSSFRDSEDARFVGVCMPRFQLRYPYGELVHVPEDSSEYVSPAHRPDAPVTSFPYAEDVIDHHERYLWAPASLAMTARIADSFTRYRWCPNIIGPQGGGAIHFLPLHIYEQGGHLKTKSPTEVSLDDQWERELSEQGFIGLIFRKHSASAAFLSANSAHRPKLYPRTPEGQAAARSDEVGSRLPYTFVIARIAHYMKVLQREQIGAWKTRSDLERELNDWLRGYVSDMPDPPPDTRARKPLRSARVTVTEVPGQQQWFRCALAVVPHFSLDGLAVELGLVGKLDRT
ncbi:type VI secretion system contractile sheath large subunit [Nannocystis punicea]|uniref:Type VI secretion system contractile sheath large subunit n=1 Tax=Nannocystis punicea TaxID=2995304 RepID=A0ABY7H5H5_9BACT|nr:type VI secretion system contractile sheath large subunit [Nannocystis poenicansa]WAS94538.1 type VI secretion system contractile sheath large subunit [Nannocystis poenicansa]